MNVGFSSLGTILGQKLAESTAWLLVPVAMVMGWFIISAEPAVHVLNKQVEEISAGAVSEQGYGPEPIHSHRARHGPRDGASS